VFPVGRKEILLRPQDLLAHLNDLLAPQRKHRQAAPG